MITDGGNEVRTKNGLSRMLLCDFDCLDSRLAPRDIRPFASFIRPYLRPGAEVSDRLASYLYMNYYDYLLLASEELSCCLL